jgi:hypothetical protein
MAHKLELKHKSFIVEYLPLVSQMETFKEVSWKSLDKVPFNNCSMQETFLKSTLKCVCELKKTIAKTNPYNAHQSHKDFPSIHILFIALDSSNTVF